MNRNKLAIGKGFIIINIDNSKRLDEKFIIAELNYNTINGISLFQGDIIVHPFKTLPELERAKYLIEQKAKNKFLAQNYGLWKNGIIYYRIDSSILEYQNCIQNACSIWTDGTEGKITFKEIYRPQRNYVQIQAGNNNSSDIGMHNNPQKLILQYPPELGTTLHELGHTIGLWHEHQRADRDEFVKIYLENIQDEYKDQFIQVQDNRLITFDIPYDYESIMHYSETTFSKNLQPTIIPTNPPSAIIGQRKYPSKLDFLGVRKLYNS
jgi:hypothetical protein